MQNSLTPAAELPVFVRIPAQMISVLAHPLFLPAWVAAWLLFQHPIYALLTSPELRVRWLAMVVLNTLVFPAFMVFLLWRLRFISNIFMRTQKERIIPLVISILFYFWAWYVAKNIPKVPAPVVQWLLGVFLSSCAAMFTNIYMKISLHAIGWGGLMMFACSMQITDAYWPRSLLPLVLLIAGLVGTSRLQLQAHRPGELYAGFLAGIICQAVAWMVVA